MKKYSLFLLIFFFSILALTKGHETFIFEGVSAFDLNVLSKKLIDIKPSKRKLFIQKQYFSIGYLDAKVQSIESIKEKHNHYKVKVEENSVCKINSFRIIGVTKNLEKKIKKNLKGFVGTICTKENENKIKRNLRAYLFLKNYYTHSIKASGVKRSKDGYSYILQLEGMKAYEVKFIGNRSVRDYDLLKTIRSTNLSKPILNLKDYIEQRVQSLYYTEGYNNTVASVSFLGSTVEVKILEGVRTLIDEIKIRGRISRDPKFYINYIVDNSTKFIQSGFYNSEDFNIGVKNLSNHVKNQGYVDFRILSKNLKFSEGKEKVGIILTVNEGPLVKIKAINFIGIKELNYRQIIKVLGLGAGSDLNFYELEKGFQRLKEHYNNLGYLEMRVNVDQNIISYDEKSKDAIINLKIFEGKKITVGDIIVKGNAKTNSNFIAQLSRIKKGAVFSPEIINNALLKLNASNIFSSVDIDFKKDKKDLDGSRTVIISVRELEPGQIKTGFGINKEQGFSAKTYFDLSYNNFFGRGSRLSFLSELRRNFTFDDLGFDYNLESIYTEPFLLDRNIKGITKASFDKKVTEIDTSGEDKISFSKTTQVGFNLEKELDPRTILKWNVWSWEKIRDFSIESSKTSFVSEEKVGLLGPSFTLDYRDNPFLPSDGFYFNWNLLYSSQFLGSSTGVNFFRTESSFNYYKPLPYFILAQSIRFGFLKHLSDIKESGVPKSYSFFLGGFSTLRGFSPTDPNDRLPLAEDFKRSGEDPDNNKSFIKNSSYFFLYKLESRIPIFGNFRGVLFYDAGMVSVSHISQRRPFRHSTGLGLRYKTPVGTINLEWAFKIGSLRSKESRSRIHFSLGSY